MKINLMDEILKDMDKVLNDLEVLNDRANLNAWEIDRLYKKVNEARNFLYGIDGRIKDESESIA